jgi:uncharacterized protein (TIGR00297 family)
LNIHIISTGAVQRMQFILGIGLGAAVAILAYASGALTRTGAIAAAMVGGITFGAGGLRSAILLLVFFISSSVLSRFRKSRKRVLVREVVKGEKRDHIQVIANGGVAVICALGFGITGAEFWFLGLAGALAAVNADTWSTEIGVLAKEKPRLIISGARVPAGSSGGITLQGTLAAMAGSCLIGLIAAVVMQDWKVLLPITLAGFIGAISDSLLGATVQAHFFCPKCGKLTERHPLHTCGKETRLVRGWPWLNNDGVNFIASVSGMVATWLIWWIL